MDIRQDNPAFARHFGLSHNPFSIGSSFQFYRPKRRSVLEQLIHFSRYSQLIQAVTGPRGSGKTVLRHAMAAASKDTALSVTMSAHKLGDAAGIIRQLAGELQVANPDVNGLLQGVERQQQAGKEVQLLVDDAEMLDSSALLLLHSLSKGSAQSRCKIILFGEPALETLLQDAALSEMGLEYNLIELEPWDEDETEGYLRQRLQAVGSDLDLFTDLELGALLQQGQGWPGLINQTAQELLQARLAAATREQAAPAPEGLVTAGERPTRLASPLPYRHIVALLVVAFLFIVAWYQLDDSKAKQSRPQPSVRLPAPESVVEVAVNSSVQEKQEERERPVIREPQTRIKLDLPQTPVEPPISSATPAGVQSPETAPAPQQVRVAEPQPAQIVPAEPKPAPAAPVVEQRAPVREVAPAVQQVVKQPAVAAQPAADKSTSTRPQSPVTTPAAKPAPSKPAAATGNWYTEQPTQAYTLQVFATASEQKAREFVQANGGQFHYFRKLHQGSDLFVVSYGNFATAEAARAAIARLPASLQGNKPWPRTFASIRKEMR